MSYADTIRELEYPSKQTLRNWYTEYKTNNSLHFEYDKRYKYNYEQKQTAVTYYLEHGKSVSRTCRILGFSSRPKLDLWILELAPDQKIYYHSGGTIIKYTREQKEQGLNIQNLTNREKTLIINAIRDTYQLKELLKIITMAKSSYCYQATALAKNKYA